MGMNEQRMLTGFFADLIKMHDINDVTAAMSAAVASSAAKAPAAAEEPGTAEGRRSPDRRTVKREISTCHGYVASVERQQRRLVGVVKRDELSWYGTVCEGDEIVFELRSPDKGKCFVSGVMRAAMYKAIMMLTHGRRLRQNRKARRLLGVAETAKGSREEPVA